MKKNYKENFIIHEAGFHFPDPGRPALGSEGCCTPLLGLAEASKLAEGQGLRRTWGGWSLHKLLEATKVWRERTAGGQEPQVAFLLCIQAVVFHLCFRKGFPNFRVHTSSVNQLSQGKTPRLWEQTRSPPNKLASSVLQEPTART